MIYIIVFCALSALACAVLYAAARRGHQPVRRSPNATDWEQNV